MKKLRDRRSALIRETLLYGIAAVVFAGLAAALWFLQRTVGIAAVAIVCAFAAVAMGNFAVGLRIYRSFKKLSRSAAVSFAFINEYGHLEIFGGTEDSAKAYAEYCVNNYAKMYRPAGERPSAEEIKAVKAMQKRDLAKERELRKKFSPWRQFDNFTPADLPFLQGKKIFVSERMYAYAATEEAWHAAREKNTFELLKNPPIGGAAQ